MSTDKPSLLNPDFSGLWSVARMGYGKNWCNKIGGSLVLLLFIYSWIGGFCMPFFILFLFYINYTTFAIILSSIIIVPYFIPISPQPWICRLYMRFGSAYFDGGCTQIVEAEPKKRDVHQPMLAAAHPHGVFCLGFFLCCGIRFKALEDVSDKNIHAEFADKLSRHETMKYKIPKPGFAVGYLCKAPIFNFFITKLTGCVLPADNNSMKSFMQKGISFGILPGGFNEATLFSHGENVIYIKQRKGFIKYCLKYGYELWPCYVFGECESYKNLFATSTNSWIAKLKQWLSHKKIPTVFPIGPYWYTPFLPRSDIGLHTIFSANTYSNCGNKIDNPTQEQIDKCHKWYMDEVVALFERNKWRFGYSDEVKLKVF